ncbi:MAG: single-stranded-DNA-specific exonuclease RecJ [Chloroflexi bacterium]|nr:single-stranded-DNA-specific exonuclease RecJ [Chloroflexota bacterium]
MPRWNILPAIPLEHKAVYEGIDSLVAQILYNRGLRQTGDVRRFLLRQWEDENPFLLQGMHDAVARIRWAIRKQELIIVYGDYDADGVTATALLVTTLQSLGAQVQPYIPSRSDEGYGLNVSSIRSLAQEGTRLIITVDCGIRSPTEVAYARQLDVDVIITDHHGIGDQLPPAKALINPKQANCRYPFKLLSGVGLAYKLSQALLRVERSISRQSSIPLIEEHLLDLVALGTVADLVPLIGENRALVSSGLEVLRKTQRPGLQALIRVAGLAAYLEPHTNITNGGKRLVSDHIAFALGPRLNASGRLEHAMTSLNLLLAQDAAQALSLATELEMLNRRRRQLTEEVVARVETQLPDQQSEFLYFAAGTDFTSGVVGLAASRLTEQYNRPSVVVEQGSDLSRGSCRSIPSFNITAALDQVADLFVKHGGHAAAAGFTIATPKIAELKDKLQAIARSQLTSLDLEPVIEIDAELPLKDLNYDLYLELEALGPFGSGNPAPRLVSRRVEVRDHRIVGNDHLKLVLSDGQIVWDGIAFRQGCRAAALTRYIDVVYRLELNTFNGHSNLQLHILDLHSCN